MFIKDNLTEIKTTITNHFPNPGFLVLFLGLALALLVFFIAGGRNTQTFGQENFAGLLAAIALLVCLSLGGLWRFGRERNPARKRRAVQGAAKAKQY